MSKENVCDGKQPIFDLIHAFPPEVEVLIGLYCDFGNPHPEWKTQASKKGHIAEAVDHGTLPTQGFNQYYGSGLCESASSKQV